MAIARPNYDISEKVRLAVEWVKPERILIVCGYAVSTKLSLVGYEPARIADETQCDHLTQLDHCVLQCLETSRVNEIDAANEVEGGCYHLCGQKVRFEAQ